MQNFERKRKPSSFLHAAFYNSSEQSAESTILQTAFEMTDTKERKTSWSCRGCGQGDRSKLVMSDDKSGWSCGLCGVCDVGSNMQETAYDSNARTTKEPTGIVGSSLTAVEFDDAGNRRKARLANASSGSVPTALQCAQNASTRRATMETVISDALCTKERRRMEKSMSHVNLLFVLAGLDPDSNKMCISSFNLTSQIFVKSNIHFRSCTNKNRTCMASMMRHADYKLIGKACVSYVICKAEESACNGDAFESVSPHDVKSMVRKIVAQLVDYKKAVGVAREAESTIHRLLEASQQSLCTECDDNDVELEEGDDDVMVPTTTAVDTRSVDAFIEGLSLSLIAAKRIGWIDDRILVVSQNHIGSVSCYQWICGVREWHTDVVAAIICIKTLSALKFSTGNMNTILKKLAKQHKITIITVQNAINSMPIPRF